MSMLRNAQRAIYLFQKAAASVWATPDPTISSLMILKSKTKGLLQKIYHTKQVCETMASLLDGAERFSGELGAKLGSGAYGHVYEAEVDGKTVAVKTTKCGGQKCDLDACEESAFLLHEFQLQVEAAKVSPHVVKPHKVVVLNSDRVGIVMEKMKLKFATNAISALVRKEERTKLGMSDDEANLLVIRIWCELNRINAETGILHGDTPANIVIGRDSDNKLTFKLFDFGRALRLGEKSTEFYVKGNNTSDSTQWLFSLCHHALYESTNHSDAFCTELVKMLRFLTDSVKERLRTVPVDSLLKDTAVTFKCKNGNIGTGRLQKKCSNNSFVIVKTHDNCRVAVGKSLIQVDVNNADTVIRTAHVGYKNFEPSIVFKTRTKKGLKRKQSNQRSPRALVRQCI